MVGFPYRSQFDDIQNKAYPSLEEQPIVVNNATMEMAAGGIYVALSGAAAIVIAAGTDVLA